MLPGDRPFGPPRAGAQAVPSPRPNNDRVESPRRPWLVPEPARPHDGVRHAGGPDSLLGPALKQQDSAEEVQRIEKLVGTDRGDEDEAVRGGALSLGESEDVFGSDEVDLGGGRKRESRWIARISRRGVPSQTPISHPHLVRTERIGQWPRAAAGTAANEHKAGSPGKGGWERGWQRDIPDDEGDEGRSDDLGRELGACPVERTHKTRHGHPFLHEAGDDTAADPACCTHNEGGTIAERGSRCGGRSRRGRGGRGGGRATDSEVRHRRMETGKKKVGGGLGDNRRRSTPCRRRCGNRSGSRRGPDERYFHAWEV